MKSKESEIQNFKDLAINSLDVLRKLLVDDPEQAVTEGRSAYKAAFTEYTAEAEKAGRNIEVRVQEIDSQISETERKLSNMQADLSRRTNDQGDYYDLVDEIERTIKEIDRLQIMKKAIESGKAIGRGSNEAAEKVLAEFSAFVDAAGCAEKARNEFYAFLGEVESAISSARNYVLNRSARETPSIHETERLVKFYEKHYGIIDVTGHAAGNDTNAKHRFLCGITAGIENTPAGRKLIEAKGGNNHA